MSAHPSGVFRLPFRRRHLTRCPRSTVRRAEPRGTCISKPRRDGRMRSESTQRTLSARRMPLGTRTQTRSLGLYPAQCNGPSHLSRKQGAELLRMAKTRPCSNIRTASDSLFQALDTSTLNLSILRLQKEKTMHAPDRHSRRILDAGKTLGDVPMTEACDCRKHIRKRRDRSDHARRQPRCHVSDPQINAWSLE